MFKAKDSTFGDFAALMQQALAAHDAEVDSLREQLESLRAQVGDEHLDIRQPRKAKATCGWGPVSADAEFDNGDSYGYAVEISGVTGHYAAMLNGIYMPEPSGHNECLLWHKECPKGSPGGAVDAWLLRFSNGYWAVTNTARMKNGHPGGWMVSTEAGYYHPGEISSWNVNVGSKWEVQNRVVVATVPGSGNMPWPSDSHSVMAPWSSADDADKDADAGQENFRHSQGDPDYSCTWRAYAKWIHSPHCELFFAIVILLNAAMMAASMEYAGYDIMYRLDQYEDPAIERWPHAEVVFLALDWICGIIFTIELIMKILAMPNPRTFCKDYWNVLDTMIVLIWLLDVAALSLPVKASFARMLRLARLGRLLRILRALKNVAAFDSLFILTSSLRGGFHVLIWAFILIFFCLVFLALFMNQVLMEFYFSTDDPSTVAERQAVALYFGTFSRAMFSMFELTLANWPPIIRVLAENVHEAFFLYGIFHKVVMGFAVVGVVNGVFMQETFKVAEADDSIMIRQKTRQLNNFKSKMKKLFASMDHDGSGVLDRKEFEDCLHDHPDLRLWLAAMDLDTSDLHGLFRLIQQEEEDDTGDTVTTDELAHGIARLKGGAKSLDMYKLNVELKEIRKLIQAMAENGLARGVTGLSRSVTELSKPRSLTGLTKDGTRTQPGGQTKGTLKSGKNNNFFV